tara:strand:+ start:724 stop:1416 length:693 start_codon:yes stop_codon:yes gene_type:complete
MAIVISGSTGGVGVSLAKFYAQKGHDIILLGRCENKLKDLRKILSKLNQLQIKYFVCDIDDIKSVNNSISLINDTSFEIDLLINVAGVFPYGPAKEIKDEIYENCMNVNLKLPLILSTGLLSKLKASSGKIINIGSSSSYGGFKNTALYCASKHAILGLSRALHDEWKELGVSVHCISPGTIDTEMANVLDQDKSTYITPDEFAKLVYDVSSYKGNMLVDEVRAVRKIIR